MTGNWPGKEDARPLALRSQDDRGPAYTAAVERSEAAFRNVRQALGGPAAQANTAAELARLAAALPPETSILLDPVAHVPAGAEPGPGWTPSVVASIASLVEQPQVPVRDHHGREHAVIVPGVELSTWLLPRDMDTEVPADGRAYYPYDRFTEALEDNGPGEALRAASALLRHIAGLLTADDGPARYLPGDGPVAATITWQAGQLAELASDMAALAPLADSEEAGDDEDDGELPSPVASTGHTAGPRQDVLDVPPDVPDAGGTGEDVPRAGGGKRTELPGDWPSYWTFAPGAKVIEVECSECGRTMLYDTDAGTGYCITCYRLGLKE